MGVKRGLRRESRLARGGDNGGSIARHALSRRLRGERAPFRAHGLFRGHRRLRHCVLRQLFEVHGTGAVGHDPRCRGRPGGRALGDGQRLCGGRGRHQIPPPGPSRRRSAGYQQGRTGPRILGRHSSASHARGRTVDRRSRHGGLPRRRRPAAAAAPRLGREIQRNHDGSMKRLHLTLLLLGLAGAAHAQKPTATVIALPPLTRPESGTRGNEMLAIGWQATQLIAADLGQTAELMPLKPNRDDYYSYPEVTAPTFSKWRSAGAKALVMGFVQSRSDGRLTVGCYVYDVDKSRELARKGFVVGPSDWRRAAHKCSGRALAGLTGAPGIFDTRVLYVR